MKQLLRKHARNHLPGGADPIPGLPYGEGVFLTGVPDTLTVPTGTVATTPIQFGAEFIESRVTGFTGFGDSFPSGFQLETGVWHISAQLVWGAGVTLGYEKNFWLAGLTLSYVPGPGLILDLESVNVIPDNTGAFTHTIAMTYVQNDPVLSPIVQLACTQQSGGDLDVDQALLAVVKLGEL